MARPGNQKQRFQHGCDTCKASRGKRPALRSVQKTAENGRFLRVFPPTINASGYSLRSIRLMLRRFAKYHQKQTACCTICPVSDPMVRGVPSIPCGVLALFSRYPFEETDPTALWMQCFPSTFSLGVSPIAA